MRFATIRHDGAVLAAVVEDDHVFPFPAGATVTGLVRGGLAAALDAGVRVRKSTGALPLADVTLDAPLQPTTIRDFVTFETHVEGVRASVQGSTGVPAAWYLAPHFYFSNPHTVVGPDAVITAPLGCQELDFELEVAAVIGAAGVDLVAEEAGAHIFGYTIFNDWSARDLQRTEMQVGLGPCKAKDFASTLGPVLVTADELEVGTLSCTAQVNGVQVGHDSLANMGWTFPELVAYASRDSRVVPGDVLGSGTIGHGGCLAEWWGRRGHLDPPPLQPGDAVTLTVEGIGSLTNTVGAR